MIKARGEDFSSMQFTCFVVLFQDFEILHDQERVHRWISRSIRDYRRIRSLVMIHVQTSATSFFTHFSGILRYFTTKREYTDGFPGASGIIEEFEAW